MEKASGKQIIIAIIEVITVPAIKGRAPYSSRPSVGFHSVEMMNLIPNSLKTGMVPLIKDNTIPDDNKTIINEAMNNNVFVIFSLFNICC
ncbi:hypothetical protein ES708_26001 [subsurface metagenome]